MADITTAQAGNWSSPATWTGGVVPGIGDTAAIGHAVTVDADTTIGTSGSVGTVAIAMSGGKQLTVADGKKLYCRGDMTLANSATTATSLILSAGASFFFDASVSNAKYKVVVGSNYYSNPQCCIKCNGTADARCTVQSISGNGTTYGYFATTSEWESATIDAAYTDFVDIDSANHLFFDNGLKQYNSISATKTLKLINCTFSGCGQLIVAYNTHNNILHILNNNWSGTRHATQTLMLQGDNVSSAGNMRIEGNVVDKVVELRRSYSFDDVFGNVFLAPVRNTEDTGIAYFHNNFIGALDGGHIYHAGGSTSIYPLLIENNYFYTLESSGVDVHGIQQGSMGDGSEIEYGENIFENGAANVDTYVNEGAWIMITGGTWTANIHHNIVLRDGGNFGSGRLIAALPASGVEYDFVMNIDNNTGAYVTGPLIKTGEGYAGHAGMIGSLTNNLAYSPAAVLRAVLADHANATKPEGALVASIVKSNNTYQCYEGSNGIGYDEYNAADADLDATDLHLDPQFVDPSRRLKTWDAALGGPGTEAHALAELAKMNTADHDPAYTPAALIAWVRAGFVPQNMGLTAGYGGTYIGAVEPQAAEETREGILQPILRSILSPVLRSILQ